jgi:hypothetical protein
MDMDEEKLIIEVLVSLWAYGGCRTCSLNSGAKVAYCSRKQHSHPTEESSHTHSAPNEYKPLENM